MSKDFAGRATTTISREEADQILMNARGIAKQVKTSRLGYAGELDDAISYYRDEHIFQIEAGRGDLPGIIPAVIELWAFDDDGVREDQFFVNRTPITGEVKVNFGKDYFYISGCGLSIYQKKKQKVNPVIWVNVITPYMPITSDGKAPDFGYLKDKVRAGIEKLTSRVNRKISLARVPEESSRVTIKDVVRANLDEAIAKVSGDGMYRYSLRQLFYAIRPYVLEALDREPDYQYFGGIITDIEAERGSDLPGIYRDSRGTILHPHTGESIALGTLTVEQYIRPKYCFNKILYLEKEGFFEILKDISWAEKNDCALISSKGYSSRATRDLLDRLGSSDEEIEFFCIHDCDAPGTMIYQALQEETRARKARNVKIIDLGLSPEEALSMGLQVEKVKYDKAQSVADGYKDYEQWLQHNRIELNAMDSPAFLDWITRKIKEHGKGKLIPSDEAIREEARGKAEELLRAKIRARIEAQFKIDELIEAEFNRALPVVNADLGRIDIMAEVQQELLGDPDQSWRDPVSRLVAEIIDNRDTTLN